VTAAAYVWAAVFALGLLSFCVHRPTGKALLAIAAYPMIAAYLALCVLAPIAIGGLLAVFITLL